MKEVLLAAARALGLTLQPWEQHERVPSAGRIALSRSNRVRQSPRVALRFSRVREFEKSGRIGIRETRGAARGFFDVVAGRADGSRLSHPGIGAALSFPSRFLRATSMKALPGPVQEALDNLIHQNFFLGPSATFCFIHIQLVLKLKESI